MKLFKVIIPIFGCNPKKRYLQSNVVFFVKFCDLRMPLNATTITAY